MEIELQNIATTITFSYLLIAIIIVAELIKLSIIAFLSSSRKHWKIKAERYKQFIEKKLEK